ncbi:histidine kinase [Aldersonia sp. NBC_00410]|nr:histidine kinase [Aldersonia sp. NBC_00410]
MLAPLLRLPPAARVDLLLVLVGAILYSIAWPTLHVTHDVPAAVQPMIAALAAWPIVLARANPALGWAISAAGALVIPMTFDTVGGYHIPWQVVHVLVLMVLLLVVSARSPLPAVVVAWLTTVLLFVVFVPGQDGRGWAVGLTVLVVFGLLVRWLVSSRLELAEQEEAADVERARRAVLEERAQIARDLHDIVAHHMSLVVVQAQSAPYRIDGLSAEVTAEFESIGATARAALNEVRGMLGVLRSDGQVAEYAPLPGIDGIDELIENSRRAGLVVTVERDALPHDPSEATGLVLYRILQESLSNAARHAPGASVRVRLVGSDTEVALTVTNDPSGAAAAAENRTGGHGIIGMRDRATSVGGTVTTGATIDGGFAVRAVLPLTVAPGTHVLSVANIAPA